MAVLPDAQNLLIVQKVQMMNKERCRTIGRKRYTTGAMCFMLFVWLGGVLALVATAAAVKKGEQHAPRPEERRLITISELLRLVQNIIATLCCSDTDRDFSEFHHKSPDF